MIRNLIFLFEKLEMLSQESNHLCEQEVLALEEKLYRDFRFAFLAELTISILLHFF